MLCDTHCASAKQIVLQNVFFFHISHRNRWQKSSEPKVEHQLTVRQTHVKKIVELLKLQHIFFLNVKHTFKY